jgi:Fanconi-associated nuclease 1
MSGLINLASLDEYEIETFITTKLESVGNQKIIGYTTENDVDICEIARCIGKNVLSCCFELLVSNWFYWSGGLPDLLIWDPQRKKAKFVEVKGPGDSLSARQAWWLRTLSFAGAESCVLYVTDVPRPKTAVKRKR